MTTTNNKIEGAVSIIGLGDMGAALARTLLQNGHHVTVWNRSAAKAGALVQEGAVLAANAAAAVSASPIIIVCVTNYEITRNILEAAGTTLAGRLLIELSTGTPQDARNAEVWAQQQGAHYLDGAILATPGQIGRPDTPIFVSGAAAAFQKGEPLLKVLAGGLQYMGEPVGAASAWDLAFLSYLWGAMTGFFHGAHMMEAEGIRIDAYGAMIANVSPVIGEMVKYEGDVIQAETYDQPRSSLMISAASVELILRQAQEAGISTEIPTFTLGLFRKAIAAGYANEEVGALFKALRA